MRTPDCIGSRRGAASPRPRCWTAWPPPRPRRSRARQSARRSSRSRAQRAAARARRSRSCASPEDDGLAARAVWAPSGVLAAELEGTLPAGGEAGSGDLELEVGRPPAQGLLRALGCGARRRRVRPARPGTARRRDGREPRALPRRPPFDEQGRAVGHLAGAPRRDRARLARTTGAREPARAGRRGARRGLGRAATWPTTSSGSPGRDGRRRASLWRIEPDAPPWLLARHGAGPTATSRPRRARRCATGDPRRARSARPSGSLVISLGEPPVGALELVVRAEHRTRSRRWRPARGWRCAGRAARPSPSCELERSETIVECSARRSPGCPSRTRWTPPSSGSRSWPEAGRSASTCARARVSRRPRPAGSRARTPRSRSGCSSWRSARIAAAASSSSTTSARDPRLAGHQHAIAETGVGRALVVPLVAGDEVIGVLAVYEPRSAAARERRGGAPARAVGASSRSPCRTPGCTSAPRSSAPCSSGRSAPSAAARASCAACTRSRRPSRASLSFEATLDAVVHTMVELFELDAAVLRLTGAQGDTVAIRAARCRPLQPAAERDSAARATGGPG